jgi:ATP-dependent RNA helicase SUPV3L1/SUV3
MREGAIPTDWFAKQISDADHAEGDIDTISNRIAHIRTWTFAANRPDWLTDPEHWQAITRAVEDKLSDALHERLTERFVDRRTSVLMRRLRENTALETDISKTGEVMIEGHVIGRLDGFSFTPAASTAGSEAKTLAGAAQKALAGEIDARASKLAQAPDGQFLLAGDDVIRWQGQPVGKLVAAEEVLKPRVRIIADEHLTGAPRDSVQARLDLWLKSHIEKVLAPLFALSAAEDVSGMARGIAFQLVEGLGVLERAKVGEEVKGLDQPARATLRKYGVRFGAYHIYLPALIKPLPRLLATQLWSLKHERSQGKLEAVQQIARSGRTSVVADKDTPKELYRTAGYRVCGERAVRVDILERLADIIRPALAWRSAVAGPRPPGAFDGWGFTVAPPMISLAGCSGEDFASILRSLGYRMEKRPKPAEPALGLTAAQDAKPHAPAASAAPTDQATGAPTAIADAASETEHATEMVPAADAAPELAPRIDAQNASGEIPVGEPAAVEISAPIVDAPETAPQDIGSQETASSLTASEAAADMAVPTSGEPATEVPTAVQTPKAAPASAEIPAQPELIEVWRPGRPDGPRRERRPREARPRRERRDPVPAPAPAEAGTPADATAAVASEGTAEHAPQERRRHRRDRPERREQQGERSGRPPERAERGDRWQRGERSERPPRGDRGERGRDRGDRPDRDPALRAKYIKDRNEGRDRRDNRDQAPDPNSPFAKLAALKQQLEGKEPS